MSQSDGDKLLNLTSFYSHHQEVDAVTIIPFTDDLTAQRAHVAQKETITEAALSPGLWAPGPLLLSWAMRYSALTC